MSVMTSLCYFACIWETVICVDCWWLFLCM